MQIVHFLSMRIISVTDGRKQLGELISQVEYQKRLIALEKNGKAEALLVASSDFPQDVTVSDMNAASPSFTFLDDEPDLYSIADVKER